MQNTPTDNQEKLRQVMERYVPATGGQTGIVGDLLKLVKNLSPSFGEAAATPTPVPGVVYQSRNLAGQLIATSDLMLATTFKRMESTLQQGFKQATKPGATAFDRENFVKLGKQVEADAAVLAEACFISNPEGAAKYKFTLEPNPGQHIPLAKAFEAVQQQKPADKGVEFLSFGTPGRQVTMMRPVNGFRKASRQTPTA